MKLGTIENDNDFKCMFCNIWSGKNKASLAAHTRNCKSNQKNKLVVEETDIILDTNISKLQYNKSFWNYFKIGLGIK